MEKMSKLKIGFWNIAGGPAVVRLHFSPKGGSGRSARGNLLPAARFGGPDFRCGKNFPAFGASTRCRVERPAEQYPKRFFAPGPGTATPGDEKDFPQRVDADIGLK